MDRHHGTNTNRSSSHTSWKTKKLMCAGIIGLTAAVASSALLFYSILDFSNQASTGSSFLLRDNDCVVGLGIENIHNTPWPGNNDFKDDDHPASADDNIKDDDGNPTNTYFFTCFSFQGGEDHCWSMSYKDWAGNWQACKPKGFGAGWKFGTPVNDRFATGQTMYGICVVNGYNTRQQ